MNRHEYKNYWIEIFLEAQGEEEDQSFYYQAYIEFPDQGGVETTSSFYPTYTEAKAAAEHLVDLYIAFPESEVHWIENLPEEQEEYEFAEREREEAYAEDIYLAKEEANEPEYVPLGEYTDSMW